MNELILLKKKVRDAVEKLVLNDLFIIRTGQERALTHRLGTYLSASFVSWHVDVDYNRQGSGSEFKSDNNDDRKVPDVIIHRRGLPEIENNLLFSEVKIANGDVKGDITKIEEFTSPPPSGSRRTFQYKYGLSLSFLPQVQLVWFENGVELCRETHSY
ncbi:MAG: hypothetical protein HOP19_15425 [Acidobacteria bacterium]|nr:hypothetical protein [Acidobacteriota bacterium]